MNRIVTALIASATFLTLAAPSFAQAPAPVASAAKSATTATGNAMHSASTTTGNAMHSAMAPAPHVTPAGNHTCPKPETYVKGYTKADGTKVKGYCRKA